MRFQGENCTLSFGLTFEGETVWLNATVWPQRQPLHDAHQPHPRLRFSTQLPQKDILQLQQWLTSNSEEPLHFTDPIRLVRRVKNSEHDEIIRLELDYYLQPEPAWWDWEISFPLKIRLEMRPAEFNYLTNALNRENWSRDLTW